MLPTSSYLVTTPFSTGTALYTYVALSWKQPGSLAVTMAFLYNQLFPGSLVP